MKSGAIDQGDRILIERLCLELRSQNRPKYREQI